MFRLFAILVRTSYLFAALFALAIIGPMVPPFWRGLFQPTPFARNEISETLFTAVTIFAYLLLALRAMWRLLKHANLVPDDHLRDRPVIASVVAMTSLAGCALILLVAWGLISTLPASTHANFAGPTVLALMLFAVALLTGECVLVGRIARTPK